MIRMVRIYLLLRTTGSSRSARNRHVDQRPGSPERVVGIPRGRRDPFRMPVGLGHTGVVEVKMHHVGVGMRQREGRPDVAKRLIPGFAALDSPHALISGPERTARPRGSPHRGETALPRVAPLPSPLRSCDPKRW